MLKKVLLSSLFLVITLGFFFGFYTYQKDIQRVLSRSIELPPDDELPMPEEEPQVKITVVPKVIGLDEEEGRELLKEAGLLPSPVYEYTDQYEEGIIFYQRPKEGTEALEGDEVIFTVSRGPFGLSEPEESEEVLLPAIIGKSEREGETLLKDLGLRVKIRKDYSEDTASGVIIEQEPDARTKLTKNAEVTLWVSLGKKPEQPKYLIPSVTGKTRQEAENLLKSLGFMVQVSEKETEDLKDSKVISQSPEGGTEVTEKGVIQLVVGKKKKSVLPPENPAEGAGEEDPGPGEAEVPVETPEEPVEEPEEAFEEPEEPAESGSN